MFTEQDILNCLDIPLVGLSSDFTIGYISQAAINVLGLPEKKLKGSRCHILFYNSEEACTNCPVTELDYPSKEKVAANFHCMGKRRRIVAKRIDINMESHVLLSLNNPERIQVFDADRESIRREEYLRSILRAAPVGIGLVVNRVFRFVNERLTEITGYYADELIGQSARMLYLNEAAFNRVGEVKYSMIREKGTGTVETQWLCKDGRVKDILLSSTPINPDDLLQGVTFTALDISQRVKAESIASKFEHTISNIQKGLASKVGETFFESIVQVLAEILKADYAYVGELFEEKQHSIETISFYKQGTIIENITYELKDTPCEQVLSGGICSYPSGVTAIFPKDMYLYQDKIEGYIGIPLFDSKQNSVGILVAMFKKPIIDESLAKSVLSIFSVRTGAEVERRRSEKELAKANSLFRTIAENLPDIILRVDTNLKCIYVNSSAFAYTGIKPEAYLGKRLSQLDFETDFSRNREKDFKKVIRSKEPLHTVISGTTEKGQRILEWRMFPEFNDQGELESILSLIRDLTESRKTEAELTHLFNLSADMICIATLEGRFIKVNPSWEKTLGYSEQELLETPFYELIHPDDLENTRQIISRKLENNESVYSFENRFQCKNGEYKWLSWVSQPYDPDGLLFAIARDVGEQKELVAELTKAKNRAEESDKLKSAFLANMSHEIRTPMNAIIGFTTLLERNDITPQKRKHFISIIQDRSDDLLSIINDILDFSKIESGQLHINKEEFSINDLLKELKDDYSVKLSAQVQKKLKLSVGNKADKLFNILIGDRLRIKQVFINLIDNAIKFTEKGKITYGCVYHLDHVQFYVSDTGIGISSDKQKKVFERFRQGDNSSIRMHSGNGLGLSISKALVNMMGGEIWLDSMEGFGSTFYFSIPFKKSKQEGFRAVLQKIGMGINLEGKKILIVEDDPLSRQFLKFILEKLDAQVEFAFTGVEAISKISTNKAFDLILMDVQLPDGSGYDVSKKIRTKDMHIPIIAQSAFTSIADPEVSAAAGCDAYLQKPVRSEDLLAVIKKVLNL